MNAASWSIVNRVGVWTMIARDWRRNIKVINQVLWPPVIMTILNVTIFGVALGGRLRSVGGMPYAAFLIPGLMMLQVITTSYGECSVSLFQSRFLGWISEVLIAPLSAFELLVGLLVAGLTRALVIASLVLLVGIFTAHVVPHHIALAVLVILLAAIASSSLGVIFGLVAESFDQIAMLTTFIITPLTFIGGVFTTTAFLPPAMRAFSYVNPVFYAVDALRYTFSGQSDVPIGYSLLILVFLAALSFGVAYRLFAIGYKLRG